MSSDRSDGNGGLDIYTVIPNPHPSDAVVNLFGYVKDYQDGTPIEAELIITDLTSGKEIANLNSDGIDLFFCKIVSRLRISDGIFL